MRATDWMLLHVDLPPHPRVSQAQMRFLVRCDGRRWVIRGVDCVVNLAVAERWMVPGEIEFHLLRLYSRAGERRNPFAYLSRVEPKLVSLAEIVDPWPEGDDAATLPP